MSIKWNPKTDMPDLEGKIVVVTGSNTGIGLETAKMLALRGAKVYLAARSEEKAKKAIKSLLSDHPSLNSSQLVWLALDLADLATVTRAIDELKRKETKIDILVNNAAMATGSTKTEGDDWEIHMAINHVGPFVFTNGILPLLKAATTQKDADVRIVTLASNATAAFIPSSYQFNFTSANFLQAPVPYHPWTWRYIFSHLFIVDMPRYAMSKTANAIFAQELQRILDEQQLPILSVSVHPGSVATDTTKEIGTSFLYFVLRRLQISIEDGAATSLFAATAKQVRDEKGRFAGKYIEPAIKITHPHVVLDDQKQVRGMWENTTVAVNKYLQKRGLPILQSW